MKEQFVKMNDNTNLFVKSYMGGFDKTILLLHGGPGAGCDYFNHTAKLLSQNVNVVTFDQRGVWRSDSLNPESFNFESLIDDIEEIKNALSIEKWHVLGHSFGGVLALFYTAKYPKSVERVIFECPSFDNNDTASNLVEMIINKLNKTGHTEIATEITKRFEARNAELNDFNDIFAIIPSEIVTNLYHPFPIDEESASMMSKYPNEEEHQKTQMHVELILNDSLMKKSHSHLLKEIKVPALLLLGDQDIVTSATQQDSFEKNAEFGKKIIIPNAGHTLHNELPHLFAQTVYDFINEE